MKTKKKTEFQPKEIISDFDFAIQAFSIRKFSLIEPMLDIISSFSLDNLIVGMDADFGANIKNQTFEVNLKLGYIYNLDSKKIPLLDLIFTVNFNVPKIEQYVKELNNNELTNADIFVNCTSLTYSTARGILIAKTQGSYLNQYLLPIINPYDLIEGKKIKAIPSIDDNEVIKTNAKEKS